MFTLLRSRPISELLKVQAPSLFGALVIAELFYKFHSFLLESIAFLATWFVLDAILSTVLGSRSSRLKPDDQEAATSKR